MARHRSPDDDDDDDDAVDRAAQPGRTPSPTVTEAAISEAATETGRHHFVGLAELALGPDPLTVHRAPVAMAEASAPGATAVAVRPVRPVRAAPDVKPALTNAPVAIPAPSRAGRDLPAAIGVGLGLGVVIALSLFLYRPSFLVIVIVAVAYGCYELRTAIATVEARPPLVPLIIGGAAIALTAWARGTNGLVIAMLLTAAAVVVWRLGDGAPGYLRDVASSMFVLLYLPVLGGFAVLLARPDDGAARIIVFVATVVCSDTGGYATGVWLGRHPLAPGVSKGKTWEGSAGSLVFCAVAGGLFMTLVFHQAWWQGVIYGAAIMVTATLGDLGESMIKRDLSVKDMGRLLPGHGGLMDRLDSILPCAAVAYLLLSWFAPS